MVNLSRLFNTSEINSQVIGIKQLLFKKSWMYSKEKWMEFQKL
jgi:hypothetical protein